MSEAEDDSCKERQFQAGLRDVERQFMKEKEAEGKVFANPYRDIYRREGNDPSDPNNYYQPSISVGPKGEIVICVSGKCVVMTLEEWHELATKESDSAIEAAAEERGWNAHKSTIYEGTHIPGSPETINDWRAARGAK